MTREQIEAVLLAGGGLGFAGLAFLAWRERKRQNLLQEQLRTQERQIENLILKTDLMAEIGRKGR